MTTGGERERDSGSGWSRFRRCFPGRPTAGGLALALACVAVGAGVNLYAETLFGDGTRPAPSLRFLASGALIVALGSLALAAVLAFVRRPAADVAGPGLRWGALALAVAIQVAAGAGALFGIVFSDHEWLFPDEYMGRATRAEGGHYYLYRGGLGCRYVVYAREPGSLQLHRRSSLRRSKCHERPRPRLALEGEEPVVVGPDGERLESEPLDLGGLWLGPR